MSRRVVITGLGTVNALANNVTDFYSALKKYSQPLTRFSECLLKDPRYFSLASSHELKTKKPSIQKNQELGRGQRQVGAKDYENFWVGAVRHTLSDSGACVFASTKDLGEMARASFGTWRKWAKRLDRFAVLGVMASTEALHDAGLSGHFTGDASFRASVLVSNMGLHLTVHERNQKILHSSAIANFEPLYVLNGISNTVTGMISQVHQFQGPTFNCNAGNASALASLQVGKLFIEQDMADVCLVGGCESPLSKTLVWLQKNIMPEDKTFGEGAGVLCLEEREHALRRGAHIYAELFSTTLTSESPSNFYASSPSGEAFIQNLRHCLFQVDPNFKANLLRGSWHYCSPIEDNIELLCDINRYLHNHYSADSTLNKEPSVKDRIGDCLSATSPIQLIGALKKSQQEAKNIL